jgi:hypothetical protein
MVTLVTCSQEKTVRPKPKPFMRSRTQQMIFCISPLIRVKFIARYSKNPLSYLSWSSWSEICKLSIVDRMNYELHDIVAIWTFAAESINTPICTIGYVPRVVKPLKLVILSLGADWLIALDISIRSCVLQIFNVNQNITIVIFRPISSDSRLNVLQGATWNRQLKSSQKSEWPDVLL